MHPEVSGNKFRKLKYNLIEARRQGYSVLLTFGGAFSNHIAAVAAAGRLFGFQTIGVVRGEELADTTTYNPTLETAVANGMRLHFVPRGQYRFKAESDFLKELEHRFGAFYLIPEGGTNALAVKGCAEILTTQDASYDYICCPVGTGGTVAGIISSAQQCQQVLGFAALKGNFLRPEICKFVNATNWQLIADYHFGGYAKVDSGLVAFINDFSHKYGVLLDPVYTGKMMFGVMDMIGKDFFPDGSRILAIHTGGLQGIAGVNNKLKEKKLPTINYD